MKRNSDRDRAPENDKETWTPSPMERPAFRILVLAAWTILLGIFWFQARGADDGIVEFLLKTIDRATYSPWAVPALLAAYLLRPLLLVPITVVNLASGFFLGAVAGVVLGMTGTLLSASVGYGIGRFLGSPELADRLSSRWTIVDMLRRRSFVSVVGGGLMYLHADAVNLPAGLLRVHYPTFLLGIMLGNTLTMSTAVLTGASVDGRLADARVTVEPWYLALAGLLFVVSLGLALWLRRRVRPMQ